MFQHVVYALPSKELVGVAGLTETVKEEREIVVVVQLFYLHLEGGGWKEGGRGKEGRKGGMEGGREGGREGEGGGREGV